MTAKVPATPAYHFLRRAGVDFSRHSYRYIDHGGTAVAARELGVDEHLVIKTLVLETERQEPLLMLMPGDREVATKKLARACGCKKIGPCTPAAAHRHTGYQTGGISPCGTRKKLPVYHEESLASLAAVYVNGGRRGLLFRLDPRDLVRVLASVPVNVGR